MMRWFGSKPVEYVPPLVLGAVSVAFLIGAYGFSASSGAVPILIGWAMVGLTALDFLTRLRGPLGDAVARALNPSMLGPSHDPVIPFRTARQSVAVAALVVFVAAMVLVGVMPSVPAFMLIGLKFGAGKSWRFSLVGAAGLLLLIWAVFNRLLGLDLYPGLLFDGDW